jgi:hypothetical protein
MSRKLLALFMGGALMLGVLGVGAAPAGAQLSSNQQASLSTALSQLVNQVNQVCASNPKLAPVCAKLPKVTQAQIDALVSRVSQAVSKPGRMDAISARIGTAKAQVCANQDAILARIPAKVPAQLQARAQAAITKLCAA